METRLPEKGEEKKLLEMEEDHFGDVKSHRIKPGSLQETFVSFANSDGGELYVGIEDKKTAGERIVGYPTIEAANDTVNTLLEETKPAVENVDLEFLNFGRRGYVLHISIPKSPKVHYCSNGDCYIRVNARKKRIMGERITQLAYAKGIFSYEKQPVVDADTAEYANGPCLVTICGASSQPWTRRYSCGNRSSCPRPRAVSTDQTLAAFSSSTNSPRR
jgi:ATP-dependent DNA helicase RecG